MYASVWNASIFGSQAVEFARFTSSGSIIGDITLITHFSSVSVMPIPKLAWTGNEFGVVWPKYSNSNKIYFVRLDALGSKITSNLRLTNSSNLSQNPAIAWPGSGYGITWQEYDDAVYRNYFVRLTREGNIIGPTFEFTNSAGGSQRTNLIFSGR